MELVTIKESHYTNNLLILKSKLESESIACFLKDELTSQILSHIPSMSVKLQVYDKDLDKVKAIMHELGESFTIRDYVYCPSCNSKNVELKLKAADRLRLFFNYVQSQLFFSKNKQISKSQSYVCNECNNTFRT